MAKYKLLVPSYIPRQPNAQPERLPAGAVIEYDGVPGSNLELIEGSGKPMDERENLLRKAKSLRVKVPEKASTDEIRELIKKAAAAKVP